MDDDDNLYFSFDDEDDADETPEAEEGQNRSFLIGAVVLGAVFVLGICAVVLILVFRGQTPSTADNSAIETQNAVNIAAATATAQFMADQAATLAAGGTQEPTEPGTGPTEEATEPGGATGGGEASPTPDVGVTVSVGGTEEATEAATEGTEEAGTTEPGETSVAEVTQGPTAIVGTPGAASPTPLQPAGTATLVGGGATATEQATSGIIEVTPLGTGAAATPTRIGSGGSTTGGSTGGLGTGGTGTGGSESGGTGGPIQPTAVSTLPNTGFSGSAGLAGAGALALALVVIVAVVRFIRMR